MDRKLWSEARAIAARRDPRGPDDLAQDLVCAALESGARAQRPAAWLERVGRNAVIDRVRVEQRRAALAAEIDPPAGPADPESVLLARERRGMLRRALALLPRPQRRAALLRFHGELPFQTVAARLGTPEVTARTRVQRALTSLRARLGSLRAIFVVPGAQAAVLALTAVVTQMPSAPSPLALASSSDDAAVQRLRHPRPVRHIAAASKATPPEATQAPRPQPPRPADVTEVPAVQRFNFDDDQLLGDIQGPEGERLVVVTPVEHSSLIEIRQHFVPEMVKSLEDF